MSKVFQDRAEAGRFLADELIEKYRRIENGLVLAMPRGGVVVGFEVAKVMNLPLDIIVTRKIGAPDNPEYAIGAVGLRSEVVNENEQTAQKYWQEEIQKERREIKRRLKEYRGQKPTSNLKDKTIILVDDGIATGLTIKAAILEIQSANPKKIIIAAPAAPPPTVFELQKLVRDVVILQIEPLFFAVGQFYREFPPTTDDEVKTLLKEQRSGDF